MLLLGINSALYKINCFCTHTLEQRVWVDWAGVVFVEVVLAVSVRPSQSVAVIE
jgi:hypothetical protein